MHRKSLALGLALIAAVSAPLYSQGTTVIRAARMIDGTGAPAVQNAVIVVTGERIVAAGPAASVTVPADASVIDLGDVTLLPGFIDAHTHIIGRTLGDPLNDLAVVKDYDSYGAIVGVANALKTLMAGFTTIRVVGSPNFDDMALRQAITDGRVPGPRMQNAGHLIGITGGHCDQNAFKPGLIELGPKEGIANGPDEIRTAVRYQVKSGADVIKMCATGGVLSEGDAVGATQYTFEEMKALVDEATKLGRPVAAHAHGTEGIKLAVRAGVTSIEHGSFLDEEGARMMAERGTYLVPTLIAGEAVERFARNGVLKRIARGEGTCCCRRDAKGNSPRRCPSREDCARNRCRCDSARNQRARVRAHGGVGWAYADAVTHRGDDGWSKAARMGFEGGLARRWKIRRHRGGARRSAAGHSRDRARDFRNERWRDLQRG